MKKKLSAMFIMICSLTLIGCEGMTNQDAGVLAGTVAGGILGSTVGSGNGTAIAIAAGAVAGALIGGAIGRDMDEYDHMRMEAALEHNQIGRPAYWRNRHSGYTYEVVPVRNVRYRNNPYCREYRTVAIIAGRKQQVYGTACRQPDGTWRALR